MYLDIETCDTGIICRFADAGKYSGELACIIERRFQPFACWTVTQSAVKSKHLFTDIKAAKYYALALAHEHLSLSDPEAFADTSGD